MTCTFWTVFQVYKLKKYIKKAIVVKQIGSMEAESGNLTSSLHPSTLSFYMTQNSCYS